MKQALTIILLSFSINLFSQSYAITYENSTYDTLVDYTSISLEEAFETGWAYDWERTFDFGFDFPFFGETQQQLILDDDGYGYFPSNLEEDYNLYFFASDWMIADVSDTEYLYSDVRYASLQVDGLSALVFEWHNVFLADELLENGENHSINYQVWFYETGVIEVRFGDIDLANCSYYFPGLGFSFDNENPEGEIYGPWLGINNNEFSDIAYFEGDHTDPGLIYDESDFESVVVTSVPNEGFVVRFSPVNVSVQNTESVVSLFDVQQSESQLIIQGEMNKFISCELYDLSGKLIFKTNKNVVGTLGLPRQVVVVKIISEDGEEIHRIVL